MEVIIKGKLQDPYASHRDSEQARTLKRSSDWIRGWWENIAPQPIYIRDKAHLKQVCTKYGVIPRAFAKPKSQGKGMEWTY